MNEHEVRRLLTGAVPDLRAPQDRLAAVGERVRRHRRRVVTGAVGVVVGAMLVAGIPVVGALTGAPPTPTPGGTGPAPTTSAPSRTDGVLETPGCATYPNAPPTRIDGTPQIANGDIREEIDHRMRPYLMDHFADVYAETAVVPELGRLRVYRKPSGELDAWIMRQFANDCVEIADAVASEREMSDAADRVLADVDYWKNRGIQINAGGGSPIDGVLTVGVAPADVDQARRELPARYPGLHIVVEAAEMG